MGIIEGAMVQSMKGKRRAWEAFFRCHKKKLSFTCVFYRGCSGVKGRGSERKG